ncbi:MAG: OsmC family protein [Parvularculaceae bacterium]
MSDNDLTRAMVRENKKSAYAVDIEVSGYELAGDEPESFGGGGTGPAPYDLLAAALGECTAMTIRWYALREKWPLDHVEVELTHEKQGKRDVFTKHIKIEGADLTAEQRKKLVEIAAKCPVQRTLEGTPTITTEKLD